MRGAFPIGMWMGAMSRVRSVVLRTDNKRSKFKRPEILSSQTWHRVIWSENRREKKRSPKTHHRPLDAEKFNGF